MPQLGFDRIGLRIVAGMAAVSASVTMTLAQEALFSSVAELDPPVAAGAREPSLSTLPDGRVLMSWTEPSAGGFAVRVASGDASGWSEPETVTEGGDLFVNWADFPSAVALPDGTWAAQWLRMNGDSTYAYDVDIALSRDEGRSWGPALVPHRDGTRRQHGFVSLLPVAPDRLLAVWLDGRDYDTTDAFASGESGTDAMQLRATVIGADGTLADETLLDARACTCCQTSATVTGDGTVLLVYRDRTEDEIRDISILRMVDGAWSDPAPVGADGWRIAGCPVNGPAIDAAGERVAVAWFTAADDVPQVKVAFSGDGGTSFNEALRIDQGAPSGRVDVLALDDGSALVSWIEATAIGEALFVCRATPEDGCGRPKALAISRSGRTIGFPRMALGDDGVYVAWTEPTGARSGVPDDDVGLRIVRATLGSGG